MIDYINYYYNLYPININNIDNKYMFYVDSEKYYFVPYDRSIEELDELVELNKEMLSNNSLVHEIIFNKFDKVLNNYNGKNYILLRTYVNNDKKVEIIDIINMLNEGNIVNTNKMISRINWAKLWESKVDFFEYQITQVIKKYPIIYSIIDYYIGLSENAILYLKDISPSYIGEICYGVCHKRIGVNSTLFDLYNPLNLIIDYKVRDFSEYIKSAFFNNKNVEIIVNILFSNYYFDKFNLSLLISRLLFPSYFYDLFEKIMLGENESIILKITKKSSNYEDFINKLIKKCNLQNIYWLK